MKKLFLLSFLIFAKLTVWSQCSVTLSTTGNRCSATDTLNLSGASNATKIKWELSGIPVDSFPSGITVAGGNGSGSATNQLAHPTGVYVDGNGNIYVDDYSNNRVQKWAPGATSGTTVAGGNGQGSAANQFYFPIGFYVDGNGNIYIADENNNRIQKWAPGATSGVTVAGGNGQGADANQLYNPDGVYVDGSGNSYIADWGNNRIQKWAPGASSGTTVAGGNGYGSAANQLNSPISVYVDGSGNIYIADASNRVQEWTQGATSGTTVAGGNGQGAAANQLNNPDGVYVDGSGNIYIADDGNYRIQKWTQGATSGVTVAGINGYGGFNANELWNPTGIYLDGNGNIYIADASNNRIQEWPYLIDRPYVPSINGKYSAVVTFLNGCVATSNTISTLKPQAAPNIPICIVTVDSLTGKNLVVWEKPATSAVDSFVILKETSVAGNYKRIGEQSFADYSTFLDTGSNPDVEASSYELGLIDTCGRLTPLSNQHTTVHLTLNIGTGGVVNLIWSSYIGINFGSYNIYRGTSPSNLTLLTTIQSNLNTYTDLNPPQGTVYYEIEVDGVSCNPTRSVIGSRSNVANTASAGIAQISPWEGLMFPNPTTENVTIKFPSAAMIHQLLLTDILGRVIETRAVEQPIIQLDLRELPSGIYLVKLQGDENKVMKLIKE